jgi:hypothetical protein
MHEKVPVKMCSTFMYFAEATKLDFCIHPQIKNKSASIYLHTYKRVTLISLLSQKDIFMLSTRDLNWYQTKTEMFSDLPIHLTYRI